MNKAKHSTSIVPENYDRMFVSRLLTKVHSHPKTLSHCLEELEERLNFSKRRAHVVGVTGAGAAGKSTLIDKIIHVLRDDDVTIMVLAIDPTKIDTGGSLLADTMRMRDHYLDPGVFLRSFPSRGAHGALTTSLLQVIELASYCADFVIVETVGAGQSDILLRECVNTLVVLPDKGGDALNLLKEGPHHHAHILAVNVRSGNQDDEYFHLLVPSFVDELPDQDGWSVCVFRVNAYTGEGVSKLVRDGVYAHRDFLSDDHPHS